MGQIWPMAVGKGRELEQLVQCGFQKLPSCLPEVSYSIRNARAFSGLQSNKRILPLVPEYKLICMVTGATSDSRSAVPTLAGADHRASGTSAGCHSCQQSGSQHSPLFGGFRRECCKSLKARRPCHLENLLPKLAAAVEYNVAVSELPEVLLPVRSVKCWG